MEKSRKISFREDRFREALADANMTQAELARKVGTSKSSMSRYVAGAPIPDRGVRARICFVLQVNIFWLTGREDKKERTFAQRYMDRLWRSNIALARHPEIYEIALALLDASEPELETVAKMLGTPVHMKPIAVKKTAKKSDDTKAVK